MSSKPNRFPPLTDWLETRQALHAYAKVLGAIRAAFTPPHPKWWHASLMPYTSGFSTTNIPHPSKEGSFFSISLELRNHYVLFSNSDGFVEQIRISRGISANELFALLEGLLHSDGVEGSVDQSKFESDKHHDYSIDKAGKYFFAASRIATIFSQAKTNLDLKSSPIQLWPHHFDLSLEIFGDRKISFTEDNVEGTSLSQIGMGFAAFNDAHPDAYIYINPYPFDEKLLNETLADGAHWHMEGWQGACFPYSNLVSAENGENLLIDYISKTIEIEKAVILSPGNL